MLRLHFITAQPDTIQYCWQTRVQIVNFREYDYSQLLRVLVLVKNNHELKGEWLQLQKDFPEVSFYWYMDTDGIYEKFIKPTGYESLVRPNLMACHLQEFPELSKDAIFYLDSDVLFTRAIDFTEYLYDRNLYLSDTTSYIGAKYFDSKENQVLRDQLEAYRKIDVLQGCLSHFGLTRKDIIEDGAGGAQYLLKNTDATFWKEVFEGAIYIKGYLSGINQRYFSSEDEGFQSFCADMWAVLFCLWKRKIKTICPKELDFSWSTDPINFIEEKNLYHDAGMNANFDRGFIKGKYKHIEPYNLSEENFNQRYCTSWYVKQINKSYQ